MSDTYFEILRPGINSSIQDKGRNHLYHIGITISGAMDQRIFTLSNAFPEEFSIYELESTQYPQIPEHVSVNP